MGRKKSEAVKETADLGAEETPKMETPQEETPTIEHTRQGHSIDIYTNNGNYVRTYSEEKHGKNYVKLAKQFVGAEKNQTRTELGSLIPKYVTK